MNHSSYSRSFPTRKRSKRGFTLIITISLLVLLTLVAIGLLSLSSVTLRGSAQGNAMSVARSNARLALMVAIGELQKTMGPDRAISATSEILAPNPGKPNLMGVWESWDSNPNASPNYNAEKTSRFRRWMVSDQDPLATASRNYPTSVAQNNAITLVDEGTLGKGARDVDRVRAGLVPISRNGNREGSYAWHVADESVKARINSYREPAAQNDTLAKRRAMLTGHRPEPRLVKGNDGTPLDFLPNDQNVASLATARQAEGKLVDLSQVDLLGNGRQMGKFRNTVTPYSMGLLTDVRNGGLKQDLSAIFEMGTMPAEYNSRRLYESTHRITGVSDPFWSSLQSYYTVYRDVTSADTAPTYYRPPQEAIAPGAMSVPRRFFPAPVIAKVEILFTYVTRDAHSNWITTLRNSDPELTRMGHLLYTPLVTLHNPYNINVQFDEMQVVIRNVPVAFNFYVNNRPQNNQLISINDMFYGNQTQYKGEKSFAINIANWSSPTSRDSSPITLRPGQSMVCGPYISPNASFSNNQGTSFFDYQNNLTGVDKDGNITTPVAGRPGFLGKAVGFDVDWIVPPEFNSGQSTDNVSGVLGLRDNDAIHIEYAVRQPTKGQNTRFDVQAQITSRGRQMSYGGLSFVYNDASTLSRYFNTIHRFPRSGAFPASEAYHSNSTPVSAQNRAKAVALFSAYARTTNGGVYETNQRTPAGGALNVLRDGRLAGKPMMHHNPARSVVMMDYRTEVPGMQSHELNFVPLPGDVDDIFEIDAANRSNLLSGNTTQRGVKSGVYFELPTGPMQTIADFRRSNALTSPYLPNFVQPVANSSVSPFMTTSRVTETGVTSYALLDHSVLANYALYDRFYFSTIAPVGSKAANNVLTDFLDNRFPLLNQAYSPYLPMGKTKNDALTELLSSGRPAANAYRLAAEYQMVKGAFNVNSTSVSAWASLLGAMRNTEVPIMWSRNGQMDRKTTSNYPIAPMSLTNGGNATDLAVNSVQTDNSRTNQWNGFRELTDSQIEALAQNIVEQVRLRGPFLSMHEFVNRQIGANSPLTRMGALQAALEASQINNAVFNTQIPITAANVSDASLYRNRTVEANVGNPAEGAPGWITQGDLMKIIEPLATVRSDTFVIRVCGEALNANGVVSARAYAEAVVQRVPEYVDLIDRPSVNVSAVTTASPTNRAFGRRLSLVSFRWLSRGEV
ncbi:MAG: type IV pilus modification PilV family protein [Akkermansiaceae bacterium]